MAKTPSLHSKQGQARLTASERDRPTPKQRKQNPIREAAGDVNPVFAAENKLREKVLPHGKGRLTGKNAQRLLLTEFLVCFTVLGVGTLVAPQGSKDGIPRLMSRGTALCAVFLILALVGSAGPKPAKAAAAFGGLIAITYLFTSSDSVNVFSWMSKFFTHEGVGAQIGAGGAAGAEAGTPGGSGGVAEQLGQTIGSVASTIGETYAPSEVGSGGAAGATGGAGPAQTLGQIVGNAASAVAQTYGGTGSSNGGGTAQSLGQSIAGAASAIGETYAPSTSPSTPSTNKQGLL